MRRKKAEIATASKPKLCRGCNSLRSGLWFDFSRIRVDGRTKLAKNITFLKDSLRDHLGGKINIMQQIIIDRVVYKIVKVSLYENGIVAHPDQEGSRDYYIALANSIRLDLMALGIEGKAAEPLTVEQYLKDKEKKPRGGRQ